MVKYQTLVLFLIYAIIANTTLAQQIFVNTEWENTQGAVGSIQKTASAVDNNGNLIVVSNQLNASNNTDVLIIKYDEGGTIIWQKNYSGMGNGNDYGVQVKTDNSNNIYVAMTSVENTSEDMGVLKYASNGSLIWSNTWDGSANGVDIPTDLVVDNSENVFLVGGSESNNSLSDFAIIKYNANGTFAWHTGYNYANLHDAASQVEIKNSVLVVTGASASSTTNWDFATLELNPTNGTILSTDRTVSTGIGFDKPTAISVDGSGNTFICGYVDVNGNKNMQTVKLNSNFGLEWVENYDGGFEDYINAMAIDDSGNVIIVGASGNAHGGLDFVTKKYDPTGTEIWTKSFGSDGIANKAIAESIAIMDNGIIVVTGSIEKNGAKAFATVAYSADGTIKFYKQFDAGSFNNLAKIVSVKNNHIYVTGVATVYGNNENATVKYNLLEKIINYHTNTNGDPIYEMNDLIVRIDTSAIKKDIINNKNFEAGNLSDFLKPTAVNQITNAVKNYCVDCDIKVYKIFRNLTTNDSTTISRLGTAIPIPHFWATLLFEFPQNVNIAQATEDLENLFPLVKYTDPNLIAKLASVPDDPHYSPWQGSLHSTQFAPSTVDTMHINIEPAWNYSTGKPFVKVGVLDNGIKWNHEDFGNGTLAGSKVRDGWDFDSNTPMATNNISGDHGTKTAGIIGAVRDNNLGIAGIAGGKNNSSQNLNTMGASLYSLRINDGSFFGDTVSAIPLTFIANAIVGASIDGQMGNNGYEYGLHIMSNGWVLYSGFQQWYNSATISIISESIHFANRANVTFVSASGNNVNSAPVYPGAYNDNWNLCVGATGTDGNYLDGIYNQLEPLETTVKSNPSWLIDVSAPGTDILVRSTANNGQYGPFAHTSAAQPHVAGVVALLMSYINNPYPDPNNLSPEDVEQILQMTATDINLDLPATQPLPGVDSLSGHGRLNAGAALAQVDKTNHLIIHRTANANNWTTVSNTLYSVNDTVLLSEPYENNNSIWFQDSVKYVVNTYQIDITSNHTLNSTDSIVAYWPRPSASNLLGLYDANQVLIPHEKHSITALNLTTANQRGYVYHVSDTTGNPIGWWPFDTSQAHFELAYSVLKYDTLTLNLPESRLKNKITVFPNPTENSQILQINLNTNANINITLFDLNGKAVVSAFQGSMLAGKNNVEISLNGLPSGLYIYQCLIDDLPYYIKVIKQ